MKQYRVIKSAVGQLEDKLNEAAKEDWSLSSVATSARESVVVILEKPVESENAVSRDDFQLRAELFQIVSNIISSHHEAMKLMMQNMR